MRKPPVTPVAVFVLFGLVASSLITPPRVFAEDQVEALVQQGLELRRTGDDEGAYVTFKRAYGISQVPRAAAQLGFCEQALGRWADAEAHLTQALRVGNSDQWVRKNKDAITRSISAAKTHIGSVEVTGEPSGATVSINDTIIGKLPLPGPSRVTAGEIEVEITMAGYARAAKSFRLEGGQYQKVVLRADRLPDKTASAIASSDTSPVAAPVVVAPAPPPPVTISSPQPAEPRPPLAVRSSSSGDGLRVAGWLTAGAAALALGIGAFETVAASNKLDEFNGTTSDYNPNQTCGTDLMSMGGPHCASLYSGWRRDRAIGIGGLVGGGALALASVTLFVISSVGSPDAGMQVACAPSLLGGLSCATRF